MTAEVIPMGEPKSLRELPHNIEAEKAFLGAAFVVGRKVVEDAAGFLKPEHFAFGPHGEVWARALEMLEHGSAADPVTLRPFAAGRERDWGFDGVAYLAELAASAVTAINAAEYCRLIRDLWLRREIIAEAQKLVDELHGQAESAEIAAGEFETALAELDLGAADKAGLRPASAFADQTVAAIRLAASGTGPVGVSTGIKDLDRMIGGLMPAELVVVAARPAMGKTALAATMAESAAKAGHRVAFFSLEMSEVQMMMRLIAQDTGIAASEMRRGGVSDQQIELIEGAVRRIAALPLMIDGEGGAPVAAIRHRCRRMKRKQGLELVVVDYLGLIRPDERYKGQRVNEVSEITAGLKALAKELSVPVVALSQLSRAVEQRDDKRPRLSDLRDSGSIEQDADAVMFLYRDEYYIDQEGEPKAPAPNEIEEDFIDRRADWAKRKATSQGRAEIIVAKQRNGPTGIVTAHFDATRTRFADAYRRDDGMEEML